MISALFGFALLALKPERRSVNEDGLSRVSECFFEFINLIMEFAPLGAFGSVAYAVGKALEGPFCTQTQITWRATTPRFQ